MTAITIGSSRSYIRNVHAAVHELVVALLALERRQPASARNRRRQPEGASLHQAYADVLAAQAAPKDAAPARKTGGAMSHAMLPYHLWSANAFKD